MAQYMTDMIYNRMFEEEPVKANTTEKQIYAILSDVIPREDYLQIEEKLNHLYDERGRELFYRGFLNGIRFMVKCL